MKPSTSLIRRSAALSAMLLVCFLWAPSSFSAHDEFTPPDCGVNSLYMLLDLVGSDVSLEELRANLPARDDNGYSMLELRDAAYRCGQPVSGGLLTTATLPLDRPAVAYFDSLNSKSGHFVVLMPVGAMGKMVQIIDPPYHPRIVDYSTIMPNGLPLKILYPTSTWRLYAIAGSVGFALLLAGVLALKRIHRRRPLNFRRMMPWPGSCPPSA